MVEKIKLSVLVDDTKNPLNPTLQAKHGLSFLIEAKVRNKTIHVLVDSGPSPDIILQNADAMGLDLGKINAIFLSHGHYDHVDGLIGVLKLVKEPIVVLAHPKAFDLKFAYRPHIKYLGSSFHLSEIKTAGGVPLLAKTPVKIVEGIVSSGEIVHSTAFERVEDFWKVEDERFIKDLMPDDQSLVVNISGKGLIIMSGCAHSGIINTINQARRITGIQRIYAVLGGFHLKNADDKMIEATTQELLRLNPSIIAPCHCTGSKAVRRFFEIFDDRCKPLRVGEILELS